MVWNSFTITALLSYFLLTSFKVVWGASVVFVDNEKGSYLQHSPENTQSEEFFSPLTVAAATAVLLGVVPSTKIDSSMSSKLNGLLSSDVFNRPHGVFTLSIAGMESDALNNGSILSAFGFPHHHEHLLSVSEQPPQSSSSSDNSAIPRTLYQSILSFSSSDDDVDVSALECSPSCSATCIHQELEALSALIGASFTFPSEISQGELFITFGNKKTTFYLSQISDRIFASELACLYLNVKKRGGVHFDAAHDAPDLLLGTLTGLQVLKNEYGEDAEKTKVAESITVHTIMHCMDILKEVYHGRVTSSLLFLGKTDLGKLGFLKGMREKRTVRVLEDSTDATSTLITYFIVIFTGLLLLVIALISIYALFSMPVTRDTLLYASVKLD